MSNRGRQNVASFLALDLGLDWRLGGDWFESLLLDYDVPSNWGNWCALISFGAHRAAAIGEWGVGSPPTGAIGTRSNALGPTGRRGLGVWGWVLGG